MRWIQRPHVLVPLLFSLAIFTGVPTCSFADKVIMKDGKIYQGHIMGEGNETILISNPPYESPHFLNMSDILTIVRDRRAEIHSIESDRYAVAEILLGGNIFSSNRVTLHPAPSLRAEGGFRLHPLVELDAVIDWIPALPGQFAVTDGTNIRGYESFYAYAGGFAAKIFPLYNIHAFPCEPYVLAGYEWTRLVPKGSGDYLSGYQYEEGVGIQKALSKALYLDARFMFEQTSYDQIQFLLRQGSINSAIGVPTYSILVGLSYRFL